MCWLPPHALLTYVRAASCASAPASPTCSPSASPHSAAGFSSCSSAAEPCTSSLVADARPRHPIVPLAEHLSGPIGNSLKYTHRPDWARAILRSHASISSGRDHVACLTGMAGRHSATHSTSPPESPAFGLARASTVIRRKTRIARPAGRHGPAALLAQHRGPRRPRDPRKAGLCARSARYPWDNESRSPPAMGRRTPV